MIAQLYTIATQNADATERALRAQERCLVSHNHVVRTAGGLYFKPNGLRLAGQTETLPDGRALGVTPYAHNAARYTADDAQRLAAGLFDGSGRPSAAAPLICALEHDLARLRADADRWAARLMDSHHAVNEAASAAYRAADADARADCGRGCYRSRGRYVYVFDKAGNVLMGEAESWPWRGTKQHLNELRALIERDDVGEIALLGGIDYAATPRDWAEFNYDAHVAEWNITLYKAS